MSKAAPTTDPRLDVDILTGMYRSLSSRRRAVQIVQLLTDKSADEKVKVVIELLENPTVLDADAIVAGRFEAFITELTTVLLDHAQWEPAC